MPPGLPIKQTTLRLPILLGSVVAFAMLARESAWGQSYTNSKTSGTNTFSGGTNSGWSATPVSSGTTTLTLSGALSASTVIFTNDITPGSFVLNDLNFTNTGTGTVSLTGNSLEFQGQSAGIQYGNAPVIQSISNNLVLTTNITVSDVGAASTLYLGGSISGAGSETLSSGAGTIILSGTNTSTGSTTLQGGIVEFTQLSALYNGDTNAWTNLTVNSGATAVLGVCGSGGFNSITISQLISETTALAGFLDGSSLGIDATGTNYTYSSPITDQPQGSSYLGFTAFGTGTLQLTAINTYNGTTLLDGGTTLVSGSVSNSAPLYTGQNSSNVALIITNGGTIQNGSGIIGGNSSSSGNSVIVTGSNATWNNYLNLQVGSYGSRNSLVISNGAAVSNQAAFVGYDSASSTNSVLVTGSNSSWNNGDQLFVGYSGSSNSLVVSNGGTVNAAQVTLGYGYFSSCNLVQVSGPGSILSIANFSGISIGLDGDSNSLVISNGGTLNSMSGTIGYDSPSSNNSVTITGSNSIWTNGTDLYIGQYGAGNSLVISNGGVMADQTGIIGYDTTSTNNRVTITGSNSIWSNQGSVTIGEAGTGTLTVANGGAVSASSIVIADQVGSSGTLNLGRYGTNDTAGTIQAPSITFGTGGTINLNQSDSVSLTGSISGSGTLNQLGTGTTILSGSNSYIGKTVISRGLLSVASTASLPGWNSNGSFSVASNAVLAVSGLYGNANIVTSVYGTTNFAAGAILGFDTTTGSFTTANNYSNTSKGALGLSIIGSGTLTLSGSNNYSGPTLVNSGSLLISGINSGTNVLTVAPAATLINAGSVAGTATINGTLAGNGGSFQTLNLMGGSSMLWNLNGTNSSGTTNGLVWDTLGAVNLRATNLTLSSMFTINITGSINLLPIARTYTFNIFNVTGLTDPLSLTNVALNTSFFTNNNSGTWLIQTTNISAGLTQVQAVLTEAVPEPSTWSLLVISFLIAGVVLIMRCGRINPLRWKIPNSRAIFLKSPRHK